MFAGDESQVTAGFSYWFAGP